MGNKKCPYLGTDCEADVARGLGIDLTKPCSQPCQPAAPYISPEIKAACEARMEKPAEPAPKRTISIQPVAKDAGHELTAYVHRQIDGVEDFKICEGAFTARPTLAMWIEGEKGCGKSRLLYEYAKVSNVPYFRCNLNGGTTVEDMLGQWIPSPDGKFVWSDGVLVRMIRDGGLMVLDEINAAPPEITFILHSLLDDERAVVLTAKDGERLYAHEKFWLCATCNPDYQGTRQVNEALRDRFAVQIKLAPDAKVEKEIFTNKHVARLVKELRKPAAQAKFGFISTRQLLFLQDNIKRFGSRFASHSFVNAIGGDSAQQQAAKMLLELLEVFDSETLENIEQKMAAIANAP